MAPERLGRLSQIEAEYLTDRDKSVKERARKAHIVVNDDHPVGCVTGRLEDPVQVLELAAAELLVKRMRSQCGIRRSG